MIAVPELRQMILQSVGWLGIVLLAIMLDRITQAIAKGKSKEHHI